MPTLRPAHLDPDTPFGVGITLTRADQVKSLCNGDSDFLQRKLVTIENLQAFQELTETIPYEE